MGLILWIVGKLCARRGHPYLLYHNQLDLHFCACGRYWRGL